MKSVLLMGNGMNRAYRSEAFSWQKLLEDMTTVENLPEHKNLPFPLEVVLRTNDQVDKALVQFSGQMYGSVESEKMRCVLAELLKLGFDEILTTNYDYTLEGTAIYPKKVTNAWLKKTMQHTNEVAKAESAYLLHLWLFLPKIVHRPILLLFLRQPLLSFPLLPLLLHLRSSLRLFHPLLRPFSFYP